LNGDGILDLISSDFGDNRLSIFRGNGNGTFQARTQVTTGAGDYRVAAGDFNGDGVVDLVSADRTDNTISILMGNSTATTGAADLSVETQADAEDLLTLLDTAITNLQSAQGNLAAIHSRLDETVAGNLLLSENLQEARAASMDVDFATEVAELVKNQILQDVQVAVLTQANLQIQLVTKLLNGNP
jgi:flagellin